MKFKVGDRVKYVGRDDRYLGLVGEIEYLWKSDKIAGVMLEKNYLMNFL